MAEYRPIAESAHPTTEISQATAVEQSRAVAEVQAAVVVAQQNHRIKTNAVAEMRDSTAQSSVAEKAFFRFPRAGQTVSGPSIHLARELARCWGNIQFGVSELRRDDVRGESEMQAYAWDLETNTRNVTSFIVPHTRDTKQGVKKLTDMRDIYENNANSGARRLRECIFAVLPPWFIDEAMERCNATLRDGGGVPLPKRIADAIGAYSGVGVALDQLEAKLGRASNNWSEHDVAQLQVIWKSLQRGEVQKDEEFPPARITTDDLPVQQPRATQVAETPVERAPEPEPSEPTRDEPRPPTDAMSRKLYVLLGNEGITDRAERIQYLSEQVKRQITSSKDLTHTETSELIEFLENAQATAGAQQ